MSSFAFGDDSPTTLSLEPAADGTRSGTLKLTVRNTTAKPVTGHISVRAEDAAVTGWIGLDGAVPTAPNLLVVDFARNAAQTVTVKVAPPVGAAVGRHVFKLRVAREDLPDTDFAESPAVAFDVAAPPAAVVPAATKRAFPWPVVAAAVVVLAAAAGGAWWLWPDSRITVPPLRGKSLEVASTEVDRLGLRVLPRPASDTSVGAVGSLQIIRTEPDEGTIVEPDSVVTLIFNQLPPASPAPRPPGAVITTFCVTNPEFCAGNILTPGAIRNPALRDRVERFRLQR